MNTTTATRKLPEIVHNNKTYIVDFRLNELRRQIIFKTLPFNRIKSEELKAKIRTARAMFAPNCYIKYIDD